VEENQSHFGIGARILEYSRSRWELDILLLAPVGESQQSNLSFRRLTKCPFADKWIRLASGIKTARRVAGCAIHTSEKDRFDMTRVKEAADFI
jgi:hypothetical protein